MITYKGYDGCVERDDAMNFFHWHVMNIQDVITFQGSSVQDLQKAFHDSVDDYLDFCHQRGETPEVP